LPPVTTSIQNIYVKIAWIPQSNNGAAITAYRVLILSGDSIQWFESVTCQSSDTTLVTNSFCQIAMAELTGPTFNLPYNRIITAKVQAYNLKGWGPLSQSNTIGAQVEVIPQQMSVPTNGPLTTQTQADVKWLALTTQAQIGGSTCTITSYNL